MNAVANVIALRLTTPSLFVMLTVRHSSATSVRRFQPVLKNHDVRGLVERFESNNITGSCGFPMGNEYFLSAANPGIQTVAISNRSIRVHPKPSRLEGVFCWGVAPDGTSMLGFDGEKTAIYSIDGEGMPHQIPGLEHREKIAGWSSDGKSLYVYPLAGSSTKISRLDVATGRREVLKEITLSDPAGVLKTPTIVLTPDGKGYVYTTRRTLTDLYVAEGLK